MMKLKITKSDMEKLFMDMGGRLHDAGKNVDVAIYGGSALVLLFDFRSTTQDVDVVMAKESGFVLSMVKDMAKQYGIDPHWFNDCVSYFVSDNESLKFYKSYPDEDKQALRIFTAEPEYILAMKILSMRDPWHVPDSPDFKDIQKLLETMKLKTVEDAVNVVRRFYPRKDISRKNIALLGEIFDTIRTTSLPCQKMSDLAVV
jgi:hypothetical protein